VVGTRLWVSARDERLLGLDPGTGRYVATVPTPGLAGAQGVLDTRGRFHACTGFVTALADLVHARLVVTRYLDRAALPTPPAPALGRLSLLSDDGRLIVVDERGRILVLSAGDPQPPTVVWPPPGGDSSPVLGTGVVGGRLVLLHLDGTLRGLGTPP
jgi:hypothetical protein